MSTSKTVQTGITAVVPHEAAKSLWSWDPIGEMERMLHSNAMVPTLGKSHTFKTYEGDLVLIWRAQSQKYAHFTTQVCTSLSPHRQTVRRARTGPAQGARHVNYEGT